MTGATANLAEVPFWYLRHGQTDWNKDNLAQGRIDVPLNATGIAQAHDAASRLRGQGIATLFASPLSRARNTAEIVAAALDLPITFDDDLRETAFGEMEGQPMLRPWFAEWIEGAFTPAGAERFTDMSVRAVRAVNRALAAPGPVLIVAHGGLFRGLRAAMGLRPDERLPNGVPFHCLPGTPWRIATPV